MKCVSILLLFWTILASGQALAEPPAGTALKADSRSTVKASTGESSQRPSNWAQPLQVSGLPNLYKVSNDLYRCATNG